MTEDWSPIEEFPDYSVSSAGNVRNDFTGRHLVIVQNLQRYAMVGLFRDQRQYKRSVAVLVATAFLDPPKRRMTPPINLNGDRLDNRAENLAWRPRWFASQYHRQFTLKDSLRFVVPIREVTTGEEFANSREAAMLYGLLERDIVIATMNRTYVHPTYQRFEVIDE